MFPYPLLPSFCIVLLQNPHVSLGTHLCFPLKHPAQRWAIRAGICAHLLQTTQEGNIFLRAPGFCERGAIEGGWLLLVCRTIYSTGSIKRLSLSSFPLTVFDIRCAIFLAFSLFPEMNGYYWRILSYKFIWTKYFANNMWHTKFNSISITAKKDVKYLLIWKRQ